MFDVLPITTKKQVDCGPACLKMLLAYYGQDVSLDTLIDECGTRLVGCSAKDVIRVGKAHGLDMLAYSMPAEDVFNNDRPSICWWKYKHFIVCCGLDENGQAVICDPVRGRYRMSKSIFKSFYSGVALTNGQPQDLPEAGE